MNAIAAVPIFNSGSAFESLPLRNYTASNPIKVANLVSINSIALTPPLTFRDQRQRSSRNRRNQRENLLVTGLQPGTATSPPKRLLSLVRS